MIEGINVVKTAVPGSRLVVMNKHLGYSTKL